MLVQGGGGRRRAGESLSKAAANRGADRAPTLTARPANVAGFYYDQLAPEEAERERANNNLRDRPSDNLPGRRLQPAGSWLAKRHALQRPMGALVLVAT